MAAVAESFIAHFGLPDLVIANAGVSAGTSGEDLRDIVHLQRLLEVNVAGVAVTLAAFAPAMAVQGRYTVSAEQGRSHQGMIETVDYLVDLARKQK